MMRDDEIEKRIRQVEWPKPSGDLRARVEADAPRVAVTIAWTDRVWFSRTFRWSVAAAIVALIGFGQWVGRGPNFPVTTVQREETEAIEAAVIDAGLPADVASSLAQRSLLARVASPRAGIGTDLQLLETGGER